MTDASTFFVPWLRRGAATQITSAPTTGRASVEARLDLVGTGASPVTATRAIEFKGPEDIIGFDPRAVVRVWPPPSTFEAEPNLFPLVELAAPDLPWRYSPVPTTGARVHPWLTLIVARDGGESAEISATRNAPSRTQPLPSAVFAASALPNLSQAAAWAHVQVLGTEAEAATLARQDPARVVARLLCPRKLVARTTYVAALVPTYARSREVGLGQTPGLGSLDLAWDGTEPELELPIYYEWRFGTGDRADFEQLARRLTAKPLPAAVGARSMDVSAVGAGLPTAAPSPASLAGALQPLDAPAVTTPGPSAFTTALTALVNRPADLLAGTGDVVVTPPLYGRWYAATDRIGVGGNPAWFETLNLDPRWRVASGLGTLAVQKDDRALLAAAWANAPQLRLANAVLLQATLARAGALRLHARNFAAASTLPQGASERVLQLAAGALPRVLTGGATVAATLRDSAVGPDIFDRAWRVLVRPRSPLGRKQLRGTVVYESISSRLNRFAVRGAYPPGLPHGIASAVNVGSHLAPSSPRGGNMPQYAGHSRETPLVPMFVLVASLLGGDGHTYYDDNPWYGVLKDALSKTPPTASDAKDIIYGIPAWSKFTPIEYSGANTPPATAGPATLDSEFRAAAEQLITGLNGRPETEVRPPSVNLDALREKVLAALDPNQTIPAGALPRVSFAPALDWAPSDPLEPILVRPSYERPMYETLRALGHEWLLPGLKDVDTDTVTLVKTNQAFVEAYMLGVNQEVNRELLWNEFPTDQRHTFFRQFWDTAGFAVPVGTPIDPDELRDIRRIHEWTGQLGTHSSRGGLGEQVVLLLRSELLRRYPNALVYACRAHPSIGPTGGSEEVHPVFSGSLPPDVTFLGFPLTKTELESTDNEGRIWYFVIQEQPSEPRFGLDLTSSGTPSSWDDLSWENLPVETNYIDLSASLTPAFPFTPTWGWAGGTDAAKIAWITYQKPVRFATPATNFLGDD